MENPKLTTGQVTEELRRLLSSPDTLLGVGEDKGDGWCEHVLHHIAVGDQVLTTITFELRAGEDGPELREVVYMVEG